MSSVTPSTVMPSIRHSEQGMNRLGWLLLILLVAFTVMVCSQVFPFFYYYYEIQGLMESQAAKAQVFTDAEIRKTILTAVKKLEIPLEREDDLKIYRANKKIFISMKYSEVLYIDLGEDRVYDLHVFEFNPKAEAVY